MKSAVASTIGSVRDYQIGNFLYCKTKDGIKVGEISQISKVPTGHLLVALVDGNEFCGILESSCAEPIPITEEFLLNNGFKLDEKIHIMTNELFYSIKIDDFKIDVQNGSNTLGRDWWVHIDNTDCCTVASADIQYVHQLQNLLNLMGLNSDFVVKV
jgi:hypothetical protein